jgi:hypothetical protein
MSLYVYVGRNEIKRKDNSGRKTKLLKHKRLLCSPSRWKDEIMNTAVNVTL